MCVVRGVLGLTVAVDICCDRETVDLLNGDDDDNNENDISVTAMTASQVIGVGSMDKVNVG